MLFKIAFNQINNIVNKHKDVDHCLYITPEINNLLKKVVIIVEKWPSANILI